MNNTNTSTTINSPNTLLQFTPFQSAIDASFWHALVDKKLDIIQLSQQAQTLQGYYTLGTNSTNTVLPPQLCIPGQALEQNVIRPSFSSVSTGILINTNTFEQFQSMDKNQLFQETANEIWQSIQSGDSNKLTRFLMLTFADLKKYKFYYWFAFPAIIPTKPWSLKSNHPIHQVYTTKQITSLAKSYHETNQPGFFIIQSNNDESNLQVLPLSKSATTLTRSIITLGFTDPSSTLIPGWPLRNLLAWAHHHLKSRSFRIVCYRESPNQLDAMDSIVIDTELPLDAIFLQQDGINVKSVGWERNVQGKLGPRMADLGPLMDPTRLADTSVDLNLKLMRWRVMPSLDLDKIRKTKCLLLGAGTLGCYVARSLLGWGVRHITFIDNGRVSFSNPVRQPLYCFDDCLNGGSSKAETAAKHLLDILPTMTTKGYNLSIPMPGHPVTTTTTFEDDLQQLTELIGSHDVIFLLTDSRESRWLPTLLGATMNKWVINAALGFDTYLVMRHGPTTSPLGCYFCNDIVAPTDSLTDRTLDQQCTVTRPGLSAIAAALAVELMVSLLQHKDGIYAQADTSTTTNGGSMLGLVPHQIRGFLAQFNNMMIVGQGYENCTACSKKVLDAYNADPSGFIKKVTDDSLVLEQITGLDEMKRQSEALMDQDWLQDDDNNDDF
ncbi:hypothetical protein BC941DRAFT_473373 [Chlamydoabsidia padenii]|nr:hypothetical protein BC941DRAFT_473373 [Chlamydoabsidia padenii]